MKLVINIPDYVKEQADDGKGEELGIPLWLAYEIANGTQLPKGHGRLIDADAFQKYCYNKHFDERLSGQGLAIINMFLAFQPTIIEADKGESEE